MLLRLWRALSRVASASVFVLSFLCLLFFGASVGVSLGGTLDQGWEFSWATLACFVAAMVATAFSWNRAQRANRAR
jgi:putative effector of murein hydrolase LrgA (UPF0299 family)